MWNWWLCLTGNFLERLIRTVVTRPYLVGVAAWAGEGSAGASRSDRWSGQQCLGPGGRQPLLEGEVGNVFVSRGAEVEQPGYCVLRVHMLPWRPALLSVRR